MILSLNVNAYILCILEQVWNTLVQKIWPDIIKLIAMS